MTSTIRRTAGAGVVLLTLLLAAVLTTELRGPSTLAVPALGEVSADAVEGSPVFVVHTVDGEVYVLDAASPHAVFPKVLAWCRSSAVFEDLWHGSLFDPSGRWISGPAPTDMARYEVLERTGRRVTVGAKQPAVDRPKHARDAELSGARCDVRTALYSRDNPGVDPDVLDDLVIHDDVHRFDDDLVFPTPERVLGTAPQG